jgi:hypothetical protein
MLSFEYKSTALPSVPDELEVICDVEGLDSLLSQLLLLKQKRTDHVHLMSPGWGGSHLSDGPSSSGNSIFHHVKVLLVMRDAR